MTVDTCRDWVVVARTGRPGRPEHLTERLTLAEAARQCDELERRGMPGLLRHVRERAPLILTPEQDARLRRLARAEGVIKDHARNVEIHIANLDDFAAWLMESGHALLGVDTAGLSATMLPAPENSHATVLARAREYSAALRRYVAETWGLANTVHIERDLVRLSGGRKGPFAAVALALDRILEVA